MNGVAHLELFLCDFRNSELAATQSSITWIKPHRVPARSSWTSEARRRERFTKGAAKTGGQGSALERNGSRGGERRSAASTELPGSGKAARVDEQAGLRQDRGSGASQLLQVHRGEEHLRASWNQNVLVFKRAVLLSVP